MTITFEELVAKKKPVRKSVWIALETEPAERLGEVEHELNMAKMQLSANPKDADLKKTVRDIEVKLEEARKEARAASVEFVLQAIGREAYELLQDSLPATKEQKKDAEKRGDPEPPWDLEEFPIQLIAASLVSPSFTEDEVRKLWTDPNWNQAELLALNMAAQAVNQQRQLVDLGKD